MGPLFSDITLSNNSMLFGSSCAVRRGSFKIHANWGLGALKRIFECNSMARGAIARRRLGHRCVVFLTPSLGNDVQRLAAQ